MTQQSAAARHLSDHRARATAAEFEAASRLAGLGAEVAFPTTSATGVDLVIFRPIMATVQVKTSGHLGGDGFCLSANLWTRGERRHDLTESMADFYALRADIGGEWWEAGEWWVMPQEEMPACGRLTMTRVRCERFREGWHLAIGGRTTTSRRKPKAEVAARIRSERERGRTFTAIARDLDRDDIPTTRGGPWSRSTVRRIATAAPQASVADLVSAYDRHHSRTGVA